MDVEETKKIIESKIEAKAATKNVRSEINSYIHEKQNLREGFKETFKPLIKSQDKVKESIDNQQNAMIKQLQENQLALTEGLDKKRLKITQGFDKMDDVKKWDLLQLPGYEAIDDDDGDGDGDGDGVVGMIDPKDSVAKVKLKRKDYFKIIGSKYVHGYPEEIINTYLKSLAHKLIDFNYKYDANENMITLVGKKTESIARFKFEDLDEGLADKEARIF